MSQIPAPVRPCLKPWSLTSNRPMYCYEAASWSLPQINPRHCEKDRDLQIMKRMETLWSRQYDEWWQFLMFLTVQQLLRYSWPSDANTQKLEWPFVQKDRIMNRCQGLKHSWIPSFVFSAQLISSLFTGFCTKEHRCHHQREATSAQRIGGCHVPRWVSWAMYWNHWAKPVEPGMELNELPVCCEKLDIEHPKHLKYCIIKYINIS